MHIRNKNRELLSLLRQWGLVSIHGYKPCCLHLNEKQEVRPKRTPNSLGVAFEGNLAVGL